MTTLYIDADACPVKAEAEKVATRYKVQMILVSNQGGRPSRNPLVQHIMVDHGPDVADDWIAERATNGDVVVTGDIPLAARCIENGADVLGHGGKPFSEQMIGTALAMRELKSHLRETGDITQRGPTFGQKDRSRFLQALDLALSKALKK
ncbi:MAG: YaiI/YqxD family protein [Alphaproteobacteria bacterium]